MVKKLDLKQVSEALNRYIRPQTFPVAYKLLQSKDEIPERYVRIPMRDMGYPITLCQATGLTRRFGWTVAVGKEDQCCRGGAQAMGFLSEGGRFEPGKYKYQLTATIDRATFDPDLIAIYGNSAQIMRLCQAAGRESVNAVATGSGDCGDIVGTVLSGKCQFILPSGGDRIFGSTQDHEVIFTIPQSRTEMVVQGLEKTHKTGFRYPIVTDLRHKPELPPFLRIPEGS